MVSVALEEEGQPLEEDHFPMREELRLDVVPAAEFGRFGLAAQQVQNELGLELGRKGPTSAWA